MIKPESVWLLEKSTKGPVDRVRVGFDDQDRNAKSLYDGSINNNISLYFPFISLFSSMDGGPVDKIVKDVLGRYCIGDNKSSWSWSWSWR